MNKPLATLLREVFEFKYPADAYFSEVPYEDRLKPIHEKLIACVEALDNFCRDGSGTDGLGTEAWYDDPVFNKALSSLRKELE